MKCEHCRKVPIKHPFLGWCFDLAIPSVWLRFDWIDYFKKKLWSILVTEHIARNCDKYH